MRPNPLKKCQIWTIIVLNVFLSSTVPKWLSPPNLKKNHQYQHPHVALLCPITNVKTITFLLDLSTMRPNPLKKSNIFFPLLSRDITGREGTGSQNPIPLHGKMSKSCPGPFCGKILSLSLCPGTIKGHLSHCPFAPGQRRRLLLLIPLGQENPVPS